MEDVPFSCFKVCVFLFSGFDDFPRSAAPCLFEQKVNELALHSRVSQDMYYFCVRMCKKWTRLLLLLAKGVSVSVKIFLFGNKEES